MSKASERVSPGTPDSAHPRPESGDIPVAALVAYAARDRADENARLTVTVEPGTGAFLPELGFLLGTMPATIPATALDRIGRLRPSHLRVDVRLGAEGWQTNLVAACELAARVGCPLELAVGWEHDLDIGQVRRLVDEIPSDGQVRRVLVRGAGVTIAPRVDQQRIRDVFKARFPRVDVVAAADGDFVILNRGWDNVGDVDGVSFAVQPQVHASDDLSIIESLDGQAHAVRTAVAKGGGRHVGVSPVALGPGGPADPPDSRHRSLFGACWTIGSIASLARAGAQSATYYGLVGAAGLMEGDHDAGDDARRTGGLVFPSYHVFADLAEVQMGRLLATTATGDLPCSVLAVESDRGSCLLVGNLSALVVRLTVSGLGHGSWAHRVLDSVTAQTACRDPERFRAEPGEVVSVGDPFETALGPFAVATFIRRAG